jgi:hypothetical protein
MGAARAWVAPLRAPEPDHALFISFNYILFIYLLIATHFTIHTIPQIVAFSCVCHYSVSYLLTILLPSHKYPNHTMPSLTQPSTT